jgi:hypothetical protein
MPEKSKRKNRRSGGRGRLDNFRFVFQRFAFYRRAARFDERFVYRARLGAGSGIAADANWWQTIKAYVWEIKPDSWIAFNLIDGFIRMLFFVTMIFSMSYLKDIRRVFEYHGAEHKTVFTGKKDLGLTSKTRKRKNASIRAAELRF